MTRSEIAKKMIEAFKAKGVPGVYGFVNAKNIGGDQEKANVLKLWADSGFSLGNHTFSHMDLNAAGVQAFEDEIVANESALQGLMGSRDWHWLRYPYLHEGDTLEKRHAIRKYLADHGYKIAQVTLDFGDYAWNNPYARCVAKQDTQAIAWLKSSYLSTASDDIALDRKLSVILFGRDIKSCCCCTSARWTVSCCLTCSSFSKNRDLILSRSKKRKKIQPTKAIRMPRYCMVERCSSN